MSKIVLSSIGSRGDVQPLLALAIELKALGHTPSLCVAPNFQAWIESYDIGCAPLGPDLTKFSMRTADGKRRKITRAQGRQMVAGSIKEQFKVLRAAAEGAELIVVGGALQTAGRSIAAVMGIPYVYAAYCGGTLPSSRHPPPRIRNQTLPRVANLFFWALNDWSWNSLFRETLNAERAALSLPPIRNVPHYVSTDHPWLAADPVLGPANGNPNILQTGAWLMPDSGKLPDDVEAFLSAGEAPIYFGFGSMTTPLLDPNVLLSAARKVGRRAIVSKGWANLSVADAQSDCLSVGELDHRALFPRVAAVVHHGGAGTTTTAALAGRPQVIVPQLYDQYYWAHRVATLGIGVRADADKLTEDGIATLLRECLGTMSSPAVSISTGMERNGAAIAARNLAQRLTERNADARSRLAG